VEAGLLERVQRGRQGDLREALGEVVDDRRQLTLADLVVDVPVAGVVRQSPVQAVADEIAADGGQAVVAAGDVAEWSTGEKLLATALEQYGRLDILVNNAGIIHDELFIRLEPGDWTKVLQTNLGGVFNFCKAVAYDPMMRQRRGRTGQPRLTRLSCAEMWGWRDWPTAAMS